MVGVGLVVVVLLGLLVVLLEASQGRVSWHRVLLRQYRQVVRGAALGGVLLEVVVHNAREVFGGREDHGHVVSASGALGEPASVSVLIADPSGKAPPAVHVRAGHEKHRVVKHLEANVALEVLLDVCCSWRLGGCRWCSCCCCCRAWSARGGGPRFYNNHVLFLVVVLVLVFGGGNKRDGVVYARLRRRRRCGR